MHLDDDDDDHEHDHDHDDDDHHGVERQSIRTVVCAGLIAILTSWQDIQKQL